MKKQLLLLVALGTGLSIGTLLAQGTADDYARAFSLAEKYRDAVPNSNVNPRWIGDSHNFWYVRNTPEGEKYVIVDTEKKTRVAMPDTMKQRLLSENNRRWPSRYWAETDEERTGDSIPSPDGKKIAFIKNSNVYAKEVASGQEKALSMDGAPGEYYSARLSWSPDSKKSLP